MSEIVCTLLGIVCGWILATAFNRPRPLWRQYNGNPGPDDWGSKPTAKTTHFRDRKIKRSWRPQ